MSRVSALGHHASRTTAYPLHATPNPSGAASAYPLNATFDADLQPTGTPPTNYQFEAAPQNVGTPPTNSDFATVPTLAGSPPTNYTFETGNFTGWTTTGSPSIQTDQTHGAYAKLNPNDAITSNPFTLDPSTQTLSVDVDYLTTGNYSWVHVYILTGPMYGTQTLLKDVSCFNCGFWRTETFDVSASLGQSVELRFVGYFGATGIDSVSPLVVFPGYTTVGLVGRNTDGSGNSYAALHATNASVTSSAFTVDPSAQTGSVRIYGLSSAGNSYAVKLLSGANFATSTQVASGNATTGTWSTVSFNLTSYQGQQVKLQVVQTVFYDIGVDDVGLLTANVPGWTTSGTTSEVAGGPTGQYLSTTGTVTSSPFTLATGEQQLSLQYKGGSASSSFYVKLLSGTNYSTVTDIGGYVVADPNTWKTLKAAVSTFAGQSVKLQIQQYSGTGLYDNAGVGEIAVQGWNLASVNPIAIGSDANGNFVTPYNAGGTFDLQTTPINPGIVVISSPSYRYYAITYSIGYATGNLLQVTWTNTATNQNWVVFSDAADTPTGVRTKYFYVADFQGPTGTFTIHLSGGGFLYSIGDNIPGLQVAEPFSQKAGYQIDTSTGAFAFIDPDLQIQGGPLQLRLTRYYNGHSGQRGTLGYRWTHTYDIHLALTGNATADVGVVWGSGREEYFGHDLLHNIFTPADARNRDTLVLNPDNTYTFTATQGNLSYHFSSSGQLLTIADLNLNVITVAYDGGGRVSTVTDPGGRALTLAYNANGKLATVTDPNGAAVTYGYDATTGDLVTVTDPLGHVRSYAYSKHRLASYTDANGKTQFVNTMDAVNRVTQQADVLGKTTSIAYNTPSAGVTTVTDPNNNMTQYYYDTYHRTTDKVDGQGHTVSYLYDSHGSLQKIIDPALNRWQFGYDSSGSLISAADPLNNPYSFVYNPQHLPTTVTDACGNVTTNGYDGQGNLISVHDPLGNVTTYTYDARGNRLTETDPLGHTTTYTYDAKNNRTGKTDALGNHWSWVYDLDGNVLTATDANGNATTSVYDLDGRRVATYDALNNQTTYLYDPPGNLIMVKDPLGNQTLYGYDDAGQNVTRTDPAGKVTTYTFDGNGNVLTRRDPLGNVTHYGYDLQNRLVSISDPLNHTSSYSYDAAGRLASQQDPLGHTTSYTYDSAGHMLTKTLPNGGVTHYSYDCNGNLKTVTDALNHVTTNSYDADNQLISVSDPLGHAKSYSYDLAGRQTQVTDAANRLASMTDRTNAITTYTYDHVGNQTTVTDPANHTTATAYNGNNRAVSATDPAGAVTTMTYDAASRLTQVHLPSGNTTTRAYDPRGLVTSVTDALGHVTATSYDDDGRRITVTAPNNTATTAAYDAAGHVAMITDALGGVVTFGYDAAGQQTSITNARGKMFAYTYDPLGNTLSERDPLGRTRSYQYDLASRLIQSTDARGIILGYAYDAASNLTTETYPGGGAVTWSYDVLNRRTTMNDATGVTAWTYDANSRVTSVAAPQGAVAYAYNPDGSRATMTLPGGKTVAYGYDTAGRLNSIRDWMSRTVGFGYNVDGQRTTVTRPNGITTTNSYDAAGRLTSISHAAPGGAILRHFSYTLDASGNRTAVATEGGSEQYALDQLGRITSASYPDGTSTAYSYDANGNRLTKTAGGVTTTYTYDDADQLLSDGTNSYSYDANGNLLTAGSNAYTWDYANRLVTASTAGTASSYFYDGDDTRVSKTAGGVTVPYTWDRQASLPILAGDGANSYVSDGSGMLGHLDGSDNPSYYLGDGLGSVRGLSDMSSTLVGSADYDVFGSPRVSSGAVAPFRFAGEQSDTETGLSFLRARYLNPAIGRMLSADGVMPSLGGTQGFNRYAYAANNPTTRTDPTGNTPTTDAPWLSGYSLRQACLETPWCASAFRLFTDIARQGAEAAQFQGLIIGDVGVWLMLFGTIGVLFTELACALDIDLAWVNGAMEFKGCGGLAHNTQDLINKLGSKKKGRGPTVDPEPPEARNNAFKKYDCWALVDLIRDTVKTLGQRARDIHENGWRKPPLPMTGETGKSTVQTHQDQWEYWQRCRGNLRNEWDGDHKKCDERCPQCKAVVDAIGWRQWLNAPIPQPQQKPSWLPFRCRLSYRKPEAGGLLPGSDAADSDCPLLGGGGW